MELTLERPKRRLLLQTVENFNNNFFFSFKNNMLSKHYSMNGNIPQPFYYYIINFLHFLNIFFTIIFFNSYIYPKLFRKL